jgi:hypothetical protein
MEFNRSVRVLEGFGYRIVGSSVVDAQATRGVERLQYGEAALQRVSVIKWPPAVLVEYSAPAQKARS